MLSNAPRSAFIPISDAERAKAFYGETLGLNLVDETPFAVIFDGPGGVLRLAKTPQFDPQPFTIVGWEVADIITAMKALKINGVTFEFFDGLPQDDQGIWTTPDGAKICWFKDPDENVLSLTQPG